MKQLQKIMKYPQRRMKQFQKIMKSFQIMRRQFQRTMEKPLKMEQFLKVMK
jgi:hypothetical protein